MGQSCSCMELPLRFSRLRPETSYDSLGSASAESLHCRSPCLPPTVASSGRELGGNMRVVLEPKVAPHPEKLYAHDGGFAGGLGGWKGLDNAGAEQFEREGYVLIKNGKFHHALRMSCLPTYHYRAHHAQPSTLRRWPGQLL